jgi:serine protease Do
VRILAERSSGSGVLIRRKGNAYTVVTNEHVIALTKDHPFQVLTSDGLVHTALLQKTSTVKAMDIAFVTFISTGFYQIADMGYGKKLSIGGAVYSAGFFNWHQVSRNAVESTHNWGLKSFYLTSGAVGMLPNQALEKGYQIGYDNDVRSGMSGGPVLNQCGQLVGINGRGKYPWQGIKAYRLADGTLPEAKIFYQMESLSWGIPISTVKEAGLEVFQ